MEKKIYEIIYATAFIIFFIELLLALKVKNNKNAPSYLKLFYIYPLVGSCVGFIFELYVYDVIPWIVGFATNTISIVFHYTFLSIIIYYITNKKPFFLLIILVCLIPIIILMVLDIKAGSSTSFALANGLLLFYCLYYFKTLLSTPPVLNLFKDSAFIICCGVLIGTVFTIPFILLTNIFGNYNLSKNTLYLYASISQLGYLILNVSFIKALLCSLNRK